MLQQLLDLYELQKIDVTIRDTQKRLEELPAQLRQLESSLASLTADLQRLTVERDGAQKEAKELDALLHAENAKLKKWDARLNEIRNQREYQALSREIEGGKRANKEAEEKIQALNQRRAELDKQIAAAQEQIGQRQAEVEAERSKVEAQSAEGKARVESDTKRRGELLPKIPKPLLSKYDNIRAKRMGVGVVLVVGGCCQGCNMRVPPQLFITLQRGQSIEHCPSCQRIIFWENFLKQESLAEPVEAAP